MASIITGEVAQRAMVEGLKSHLRAALKDHFDEAAKPIIEEAIESAMQTFDASVQQFMSADRMGGTIEVVLRDARSR